jgi:hypothetical protein
MFLLVGQRSVYLNSVTLNVGNGYSMGLGLKLVLRSSHSAKTPPSGRTDQKGELMLMLLLLFFLSLIDSLFVVSRDIPNIVPARGCRGNFPGAGTHSDFTKDNSE